MKLKELGYHHTEEGRNIINLFLGLINNNRLSTNKLNTNIDREKLIIEANELLNKGTNYETLSNSTVLIKSNSKILKEGISKKVLVKDENGNTLLELESIEKCGKYFNTSHQTIRKRIRDNKSFKYGLAYFVSSTQQKKIFLFF